MKRYCMFKIATWLTVLCLAGVLSCSQSEEENGGGTTKKESALKKEKPKKTAHKEEPPKTKYTVKVVPKNMTVAEKKARFRALVAPAVDVVYQERYARFQNISAHIKKGTNRDTIKALKERYEAKNNAELLMALKPPPKSIVMAQAALESAWATSRFFREGYNVFGIWSFSKNEPRMAASKKRNNKTIWVRKYASIEESVRGYYRTIAYGQAYKKFRALNMTTQKPDLLVKQLDKYSEKGAKYGKTLTTMIKYNKFYLYDQ